LNFCSIKVTMPDPDFSATLSKVKRDASAALFKPTLQPRQLADGSDIR
jgi:hypothetical protein